MPCRIRVFRTESRAESINITESSGAKFSFELTTYRKIGRASKKVFFKVNVSVFVFWCFIDGQCCYPEHFTSTFSIACCDDRGMHVNESFVIKEFMNCKRQ